MALALAAGALSIAALAFVLSRDNAPLPTSAAAASGVATAPGAPDISNMSPRERAARLYDRVMQYAEQGRQDSVDFFAPMALASHESLGELDLDARYDYGRIAVVSGNVTIAKAQADSILAIMPTHLLGLSLAARAAEEKSDAKEAAKFWTAFKKARDTELAKKLPEYVAHASDIEQATRAANRE